MYILQLTYPSHVRHEPVPEILLQTPEYTNCLSLDPCRMYTLIEKKDISSDDLPHLQTMGCIQREFLIISFTLYLVCLLDVQKKKMIFDDLIHSQLDQNTAHALGS